MTARRDPQGPFDWLGQMRPRFFDGFHRCIPALAAAGNNVLVEHVVEHRAWRVQLDQLLAGYDVFWVGVTDTSAHTVVAAWTKRHARSAAGKRIDLAGRQCTRDLR